MQEIFADATSGNAWTNRTLCRIRRTRINGSIPFSAPIHSVMRKYSTRASSDSSETRVPIGTGRTSTAPPAEAIRSPDIGDKRQSDTPILRDSNKLDTYLDGKLTSNLAEPPILSDVVSEKLLNSYRRDLYDRAGMHLAADLVNILAPQFVDLGFSTIDYLDNGSSL